MKNRSSLLKSRWFWICAGGVLVYILLLCLLVAVEASAPNASIRSLSDALWYSFVTLSTVGYGDLYPVTPFGKFLGIVFILLSTGLLTFLIGAVLSLFFDKLLPSVRILGCRNTDWYIFLEMNSASCALAENLATEQPCCTVIFLKDNGQEKVTPDCKHLLFPGSLDALLSRKGKKGSCHIFSIGGNGIPVGNFSLNTLGTDYHIYTQTELEPDHKPANLAFFNPHNCCARLYWQQHPLKSEESRVVLIGDGKYAQQLLEQGLLVNVRFPGSECVYYPFGDWDNYRRNHPQLGLTLDLTGQDSSRDRVVFSSAPWNADPSLLEQAHRIILCADSDAENLSLFHQLCRCFPINGSVYLLGSNAVEGAVVFGGDRDVYTPELIMRKQLNRAATAMHEIYRKSSPSAPSWEELSEFTRQSNIAAADHLLTKIRLLTGDDTICQVTPETCRRAYEAYWATKPERAELYRRTEHLRWMRFHSLYNWRYAPVRCNPRREHPMLVPYEALSAEEQHKDDYAWEMLDILSRHLG